MKSLISTVLFFLMFISSYAVASFGPTEIVSPVTVDRIYQGVGATYVTFQGAVFNGCHGSSGYLQPTWPLANDGEVDDVMADRMLSVLLFAKAQNVNLEVRYKVNSAGTGWDKCAITGIYLY